MPVLRILEETMNHLKKWAKPLESKDESTFVKVLDCSRGRTRGTPKNPGRQATEAA